MLLGSLALLAGCGFELRRERELHFRSLALVGFVPASPLAAEIKRQIERTQAKLVENPAAAEVVLEVKRELRDKAVVVSTSAGQVREWQLRLHFDFLLRTAGGEIILPRKDMLLTRELTFTETAALGKSPEEAALYRAMQSDAVAQVMSHLAAVKL
ncbi:MAG TPA: LPS assembly lipoprotein LptE [Burkholderiaceae bacterium]